MKMKRDTCMHVCTQTHSRLHIDAGIHTHEEILLLPSISAGSESHIQIFLLSHLSQSHVLVLQ